MIKTVVFLSSDGGAGKTACSHLLALGCAWHELDAAVLHTDDKDPIAIDRPYHFFDCREKEKLVATANNILNSDSRGVMIIDGGAGRKGNDTWFSSHADLVVIPAKLDSGSIKEALKTEAAVKEQNANYVFALVECPSNPSAKDLELIARLGDPKRIAAKVPTVKAIRDLLDDDPEEGFKTPITKVNNAARGLYRQLSIYW